MTGTKFDVRAADGMAEAFLFRPPTGNGPWPGVVHLTDIWGIRDAYNGMAQRLADEGFAVLLPNVFYRDSKLPVVNFEAKLGEPRTMKRLGELFASEPADKMGPDAEAYADFLLALPDVKGPKVGVVGFCFTGAMALRAAAHAPDKFAAAVSFHGGGLVTDKADSPHLLLPKIAAKLHVGHAVEDRTMPAEAMATFDAAMAASGHGGESETYEGALHGWTVPGRPAIYNERQANRAFAKMVEVFRGALR